MAATEVHLLGQLADMEVVEEELKTMVHLELEGVTPEEGQGKVQIKQEEVGGHIATLEGQLVVHVLE